MKFVDGDLNVSDFDPQRDIPNVREVHLDNGRTLKMKRKDPYGLVYIEWDRGAVPDKLSGSYTSFERARQALTNYIANETFAQITEEPVPKVEPLQYKKKFRDPETGKNLEV